MMLLRILAPEVAAPSSIPKPENPVSIVKPSMVTLFAVTENDGEPVTTASASGRVRVRASTPACGPLRLRLLSTTTDSTYVPVPTCTKMVSPAAALATARLIVKHAVAAVWQLLASLPVAPLTTKFAARARLLPNRTAKARNTAVRAGIVREVLDTVCLLFG